MGDIYISLFLEFIILFVFHNLLMFHRYSALYMKLEYIVTIFHCVM